MVVKVAQLDRALDCGSRGRGFESRLSPLIVVSDGVELYVRAGQATMHTRDENTRDAKHRHAGSTHRR